MRLVEPDWQHHYKSLSLHPPGVSATMRRMEPTDPANPTPTQEPIHEDQKPDPWSLVRRYPPELWMVVVALLVRILLIYMANEVHFQEDKDDLSFVNEMSQVAGALASGHGFSSPFGGPSGPTAWVPPVYPALCGFLFKLMGGYGLGAVICVLAMNSLFSALTCIPLVRIAERIFDRRLALICGWLWALVPYFAKWSVTWIWETTLSTLLMSWLFLQFLELRDN